MGTYSTLTSLTILMTGTDFSLTAMNSLGALAINRAETEINKYLSKRYDLSSATFQTSTSVPPMVRDLCNELSVGYAYKFLSRGRKESIERAHLFIDPVIDNLKEIRDHKHDLVNTSGSVIPEAASGVWRIQSNTSGYSNTFNEDDPLNWETDVDKLDDISDDRSG